MRKALLLLTAIASLTIANARADSTVGYAGEEIPRGSGFNHTLNPYYTHTPLHNNPYYVHPVYRTYSREINRHGDQ
jgi:hypothetical protein